MLLVARNIKKTYGKGDTAFEALKGVRVSIERGQSVAITGKSGSGKSTLMHLLAALDRASGGDIALNGEVYGAMSAIKLDNLRSREFGFIFQQFFLSGRESVLENVMLPLKIAGVGRREHKQRALQALQAVEMSDRTAAKAADLSGGQKQRVAIARALVANPNVIFADEPTGNLDSENGARVEQLLFTLNRRQGITLIIVTHDADLAAKCDRRLQMKDGRLAEVKK